MKMRDLLWSLSLALLPSAFKVPLMRLRGARIASGAKISIFALVIADEIQLGEGARIGPFSLVRCRSLAMGNRALVKSLVAIDTDVFKLGHDSIIMEQVVVGGMKTPRSALRVGSRVKIFPYCFINPTEPIVIEDEVGVGGSTYIFTHGSWQSALDGYPIAFGPVTIRKGVWLPWRVFILPNVEIGEMCTVGAGAVINKSVPANSLVAGIPAKVISSDGAYLRPKSQDEKAAYVDQILQDMFDFWRHEGAQVRVETDEDGLLAQIRRNGRPARLLRYTRSGNVADRAAHVLLSLASLEGAALAASWPEGFAWLDLHARECTLGDGPLASEVRNFFGRYGVRFAVHGELPL